MLYYPKIPGSMNCPSGRCIAFVKYDGTNLHFEWDRDFGWVSFGTRRDRYDISANGIARCAEEHPMLETSVEAFNATYAGPLERVIRDHPFYRDRQRVLAFAEFFGPNSFAGEHRRDDPKELVLFDVEAEGYGIVGPRQFVDDFGGLKIARVVYEGKLTGKFAEDVRAGRYGDIEGVVCKGGTGGADLWMAKIKTNAYLEKLKRAHPKNYLDYWE